MIVCLIAFGFINRLSHTMRFRCESSESLWERNIHAWIHKVINEEKGFKTRLFPLVLKL